MTIQRNRPLTGEILRDALRRAGKPPRGTDSINVTSFGTDAVISQQVDQHRARLKFFGEITTSLGNGEYEWKEFHKATPGIDGWAEKKKVDAKAGVDTRGRAAVPEAPPVPSQSILGTAFNLAEILGGSAVEVGRIVELTYIRLKDGDQAEVWFDGGAGAGGLVAIITSFQSTGANTWEYSAQQAVSPVGPLGYVEDPLGQVFLLCLNLIEQKNTATTVSHGVDVTPSPEFSVTVDPIPVGAPVLLHTSNGNFFSEPNATNFTCIP